MSLFGHFLCFGIQNAFKEAPCFQDIAPKLCSYLYWYVD